MTRLFSAFALLITTTVVLIFVLINTGDFNLKNSSKFEERDLSNPSAENARRTVSHKEKYRERAKNIHTLCLARARLNKTVKIRTKRFKFSDRARTVLCETPKVASTSWQSALLKLGGFKDNITSAMLTKWAFSMMPNQVFSSLKTEEQAFQLTQNYTTILVVRHPFERIVSAYKNKLSNESDYDYYRDAVGKRIAREQASSYVHGLSINNVASMTSEKLKNLTNFQNLSRVQQKEVLEYSLVMKTGLISFQQFVKFLTKYATIMNLSDMDIHWRPQTDMCVPCHVNYTYIIHFENLVEESNEVLRWIQQDQTGPNRTHVTMEGNVRPSARESTTHRYFSKLDESDVQILRKIYANDFELLGYDKYLYNGTSKG